jgi:hypothetical protein
MVSMSRMARQLMTAARSSVLPPLSERVHTATGPRKFRIHESDGAPDEKERRPKYQPPGYQACMMAQ